MFTKQHFEVVAEELGILYANWAVVETVMPKGPEGTEGVKASARVLSNMFAFHCPAFRAETFRLAVCDAANKQYQHQVRSNPAARLDPNWVLVPL